MPGGNLNKRNLNEKNFDCNTFNRIQNTKHEDIFTMNKFILILCLAISPIFGYQDDAGNELPYPDGLVDFDFYDQDSSFWD